MERIVYVQDDRYEMSEELLMLSQEELQKKINEERDKEIQKKKSQLSKFAKTIA